MFVLHYWPVRIELTLFETTILNSLLAANIITQALHLLPVKLNNFRRMYLNLATGTQKPTLALLQIPVI